METKDTVIESRIRHLKALSLPELASEITYRHSKVNTSDIKEELRKRILQAEVIEDDK